MSKSFFYRYIRDREKSKPHYNCKTKGLCQGRLVVYVTSLYICLDTNHTHEEIGISTSQFRRKVAAKHIWFRACHTYFPQFLVDDFKCNSNSTKQQPVSSLPHTSAALPVLI